MIAYRTKGIAKLGIICQCVAITLGFWLWLPLSQGRWEIWSLNVHHYLVYNVIILIGIAFAYATTTSDTWFTQRIFFVCHRNAFRQTAFAGGLLLLLLIGQRDENISRLFLFTFLPILYAILIATQRYLPALLQRASFGGVRAQRVLVAGNYQNIASLHGWLTNKEQLGYFISGLMCHDRSGGTLNGFKILGTLEDLERIIVEWDITQVVLAEFPQFRNFLTHYTEVCERHGVRLLVVCDFERTLRHPVTMFEDEGVRFLGLRDEPLEDPFGRFSKRCLDIALALPVVLFILPFTTVVVAYLQWRHSPGPIFFRHLRAGLQNMPFAIYKYRTMHVNNGDPTQQATKGDQRIYPGGQWLRKYSIDELPQFLNVLFGEMSVVGPRPHLLQHNEHFAHALSNYPVRANVKPGITGLAQIRGFRGETKTAADVVNRVESDIQYLENWSFPMDCWIIMRTATQMVVPPSTAY
jgi:exopolysaccharide biosynthesis polyprenyl glycosylphosphotransferase